MVGCLEKKVKQITCIGQALGGLENGKNGNGAVENRADLCNDHGSLFFFFSRFKAKTTGEEAGMECKNTIFFFW